MQPGTLQSGVSHYISLFTPKIQCLQTDCQNRILKSSSFSLLCMSPPSEANLSRARWHTCQVRNSWRFHGTRSRCRIPSCPPVIKPKSHVHSAIHRFKVYSKILNADFIPILQNKLIKMKTQESNLAGILIFPFKIGPLLFY